MFYFNLPRTRLIRGDLSTARVARPESQGHWQPCQPHTGDRDDGVGSPAPVSWYSPDGRREDRTTPQAAAPSPPKAPSYSGFFFLVLFVCPPHGDLRLQGRRDVQWGSLSLTQPSMSTQHVLSVPRCCLSPSVFCAPSLSSRLSPPPSPAAGAGVGLDRYLSAAGPDSLCPDSLRDSKVGGGIMSEALILLFSKP